MSYPQERKEAILQKMMPPSHQTIKAIAASEGVSEATLYKWRKEARGLGRLLPAGESTPKGWCSTDKFSAVLGSVDILWIKSANLLNLISLT